MMGNIFSKISVSDFVADFRKRLIAEIDKLEVTESTNVIQLVDRLLTKYTIEPLVLKEAIPSEPIEKKRGFRNSFGENYYQSVYEISVRIPFDGNHELFQCRPTKLSIINLDENVQINSNTIYISIELDKLDSANYYAQLSKITSDLSHNIPRVNAEIAPWNNDLESYIKSLLELRKGVVAKKFDFMEKIGLKVNPKSDDFMIPPPIAKKTIPTPVTETTKHIEKEKIPLLQDEVYKDIREVLYNVGKAIERKPSLYFEKHEEDLRDIFLLFLETRYDSTSGVGEAFNKKGKTDILLKYAKDGTNVFVAECKFWKGQKEFHKGITQLLGYLTHRDSKTALVLFVDQKEFTSVVSTVKDEIKNHPQFKRHSRDTYEHSINYEFVLPDDTQKTIRIEVMMFHYPPVK